MAVEVKWRFILRCDTRPVIDTDIESLFDRIDVADRFRNFCSPDPVTVDIQLARAAVVVVIFVEPKPDLDRTVGQLAIRANVIVILVIQVVYVSRHALLEVQGIPACYSTGRHDDAFGRLAACRTDIRCDTETAIFDRWRQGLRNALCTKSGILDTLFLAT